MSAQIYPVDYSYNPGTTADGLGTVPDGRDDPEIALGAPDNSDIDSGEVPGDPSTVNFVSLGFGGYIDLVFAEPFGQGEGRDLDIFETSYNTPNCGIWPELANIYVSQDGCNWLLIASGECQNFSVELPDNMPWALYVRIEDASPNNQFSPDADGYDVDGVYGYPCNYQEDGRYAMHDQNNYPDEDENMFFAGLAPNPAAQYVNVKIEAAGTHENYMIRVIDMMGRVVAQESLNADANAYVNYTLSVDQSPAGVYILSVETRNHKVVERLIKN